jgi:hypothetical protein
VTRVDEKESRYVPQPADTREEVERRMFERYRQMTPAQKVQMMSVINAAVDAFELAGLRRKYPDDTERELRLRLAARRYGRELVIKAFGWDPGEP